VTVTGVDDSLDDGNISYSIVTAATTSADGNYSGLDPNDVAVTNTDNDASGITVSTISGNTTEAGGTATFTIVLTAQPTADVTVGVGGSPRQAPAVVADAYADPAVGGPDGHRGRGGLGGERKEEREQDGGFVAPLDALEPGTVTRPAGEPIF